MYSHLPESQNKINVLLYAARSEQPLAGSLERRYLALMPDHVSAAIGRYRRWRNRQATLFGKLLLLRALRILFPDDGARLFQLQQLSPDGKPFIPHGPEFSISHSGDLVVLAIRRRGAVGVDIEKNHDIALRDFVRYLPEVVTFLEEPDAERSRQLFFDCWTKKEAVLKGSGRGLLTALEEVRISGDRAELHGAVWYLEKLFLEAGYCCHLATRQPVERISVEWVDLLNGEGNYSALSES